MVNGGTWDIGEVADCAPDKNWDFVPFPEGPGGSGPGTATWYNMVVMPEKAKNPEGSMGMDAILRRAAYLQEPDQ